MLIICFDQQVSREVRKMEESDIFLLKFYCLLQEEVEVDACRAVMQQVQRLSNVSTIFLRSHQTGFLCTFNCISWKNSKYLPGAKCAMILSSIYLPLDDFKSVGNLRQSSNSISPSLLHLQHHHHHHQQYYCLQQQHHCQQHHHQRFKAIC